jgi:cellulose synthase/poly-beta-1,6-N-acetylglucosamine synthase-like glycosyltransferase
MDPRNSNITNDEGVLLLSRTFRQAGRESCETAENPHPVKQPHFATRSGCQAKPFFATPLEPILTVIVPVYNEEKTIDAMLRRVLVSPYPKQIIVGDDGSTDGTADILEKWREDSLVDNLSAKRQGYQSFPRHPMVPR